MGFRVEGVTEASSLQIVCCMHVAAFAGLSPSAISPNSRNSQALRGGEGEGREGRGGEGGGGEGEGRGRGGGGERGWEGRGGGGERGWEGRRGKIVPTTIRWSVLQPDGPYYNWEADPTTTGPENQQNRTLLQPEHNIIHNNIIHNEITATRTQAM